MKHMSRWWRWVRFINVKMRNGHEAIKISTTLLHTHSRRLCGVWLWAFPSSSRPGAAAFCPSSASPSRPPSCPPSPPEWASTPRSWWFLKRARVSQGRRRGWRRGWWRGWWRRMPQTGTIISATKEKALLLHSLFISRSVPDAEVKGSWCGASQTKMGAEEEKKPSRETRSKQTFSNKAICQTHIPLLVNQMSLIAASSLIEICSFGNTSVTHRDGTSAFITNRLVWAW